MRPSSRTEILGAAVRLLDREGGAVVSFESVAGESGLSKAGVLYHFPSRDELMLALNEYVSARWESAMVEALPRSFEESSAAERMRAYVTVLITEEATRADFAVYAEALYRPAFGKPWRDLLERWVSDVDDLPSDERERLLVVRFAAEGLWIARATEFGPPARKDQDAIVSKIMSLIQGF